MTDPQIIHVVSGVVGYIVCGVLVGICWAGIMCEEDDDTVLLAIPLWPIYVYSKFREFF